MQAAQVLAQVFLWSRNYLLKLLENRAKELLVAGLGAKVLAGNGGGEGPNIGLGTPGRPSLQLSSSP